MSGHGRAQVALRWVALAATLTLTSHAEWQAGVAAGLPPALALVLPLSIDCYVVAALLGGRDVLPALALLWASVVAGSVHAAHEPRELAGGIALGTALTVALWRVDLLFRAAATEPADAAHLTKVAAARTAATPRARTATGSRGVAAPVAAGAATPSVSAAPRAPAPPVRLPHGAPLALPDRPVRDLAVPEQVAWLAGQLAAHPARTVEDWCRVTGWSQRTTARRLADARGAAA